MAASTIPPSPGRSTAPQRFDITAQSLVRIALAGAILWLLVHLFDIILVVVVGLMILGMIAPVVTWLENRKIGRGVAIAIAFGGFVVIGVALTALTIPPLVSQLSDIIERLPKTQTAAAKVLQEHRITERFAQTVRDTKVPELIADAAKAAFSYSPQIVEIVGGLVTAAFLALYLLIDRDRMRGGLFALVPRTFHVRLSRILLGLEIIVGGYIRGQAITSLLMAVVTFVVLAIAKVPSAMALAMFAGVVDVLPYIGGILAAGPAVLAALVHGPTVALVVAAVLFAYQEFENRFIVPRVYGNVLRLPSAVVIIVLLIGGKLLGVLGALLALPIAAGIRMIIEELRVELPGEVPEDPSHRLEDERGEREYKVRADGVRAAEAAVIATEIAHTQAEQDLGDSAREKSK